MQVKQIQTITLAIFSISILLSVNFIINPVYALRTWTVTLAGSVATGAVDYLSGSNLFIGTRLVASDHLTVVTLNPLNNVTTLSGNIGVPTNSGSYSSITLECSPSRCYTLWDQVTGSSGTDQYISFSSGGALLSTSIALRDLATNTTERIADNSMFSTSSVFFGVVTCSTIDSDQIVITLNSGLSQITGELMDCTGVNMGTGGVQEMRVFGTRLAITETDRFSLWNTGGGFICSNAVSTYTGATGAIGRLSNSWVVSTTTTVLQFDDTCTLLDTITAGDLGGIGTLISIDVDTSRDEYYVCSTTECAVMQKSDPDNKLYQFNLANSGRTSANQDYVSHADDLNIIGGFVTATATLVEISDAEEDTGNQGASDGVCLNVDVNGDGKVNVLDCVGQTGGALETLTATHNATEIGTTLCQGLGVCDPDNDDPKTNGVGLIYMLLLGLFVTGAIMGGAKRANLGITDVHPAVWLFFAVGVTGLAGFLGWVDLTFFYAMLVVCAGIGAFGIFTGKLKFGGS